MKTKRIVALGRQVDMDLYGCDREVLSNGRKLVRILKRAATIAGATVLRTAKHGFSVPDTPDLLGWTVVLILAESELSVHTYPEEDTAMIVFFTCGHKADPRKAKEFLRIAFGADSVRLRSHRRGLIARRPHT